MMIQKEAVALGRLAELVPATPYVVRLVDAGLGVAGASELPSLGLPWLAMEYIHGGLEGTTLAERLERTAAATGQALDPARAAHALRCIAAGVSAIHAAGVLHRDLTPGNILCCGFGDHELFKVTDFGLARSAGMLATFGDRAYGTPGFAAPEQIFPGEQPATRSSDVFSLACLVYAMLTCDQYFPTSSQAHALVLVRDAGRPRLLDAPLLAAALRDNVPACSAIDQTLRSATAWDAGERPQTPLELAQAILPWLDSCGDTATDSRRVRAGAFAGAPHEAPASWEWTIRHPGRRDVSLRQAAWDGDGHLLATTPAGLAYFDGARYELVTLAEDAHFCHRQGPGRWLVGGRGGWIGVVDEAGLHRVQDGFDPTMALVLASGQLDETLVIVEQAFGQAPVLRARAAGRWHAPWPVPDVASVTSLTRLDGWRWLVTGRHRKTGGFAWIYAPLVPSLSAVALPPCRMLTAATHLVARAETVIAGADGVIVEWSPLETRSFVLEGRPALSAAAVDEQGRKWVGGAGRLWTRTPTEPWSCAFRDDTLSAPFIGLFTVSGRLFAAAADGTVLEGARR
jgi:hypothetical protein